MRVIIILASCIIAHAINPQIMALYQKDMDGGYLAFVVVALVLGGILDFVDLIKKLKQ